MVRSLEPSGKPDSNLVAPRATLGFTRGQRGPRRGHAPFVATRRDVEPTLAVRVERHVHGRRRSGSHRIRSRLVVSRPVHRMSPVHHRASHPRGRELNHGQSRRIDLEVILSELRLDPQVFSSAEAHGVDVEEEIAAQTRLIRRRRVPPSRGCGPRRGEGAHDRDTAGNPRVRRRERRHLHREPASNRLVVLQRVRGGRRRLQKDRLGVRLLDPIHAVHRHDTVHHPGPALGHDGEHRPRDYALRWLAAARERPRRRPLVEPLLLLGEVRGNLLIRLARVHLRIDPSRRRGYVRELHESPNARGGGARGDGEGARRGR
mmetsp:Transcript_14346/g.58439  ORF Transcript_14346/g.58439 Transcript_14346/m.58439 type:complete len:318 (-) Transcript_14346:888-1841(-)